MQLRIVTSVALFGASVSARAQFLPTREEVEKAAGAPAASEENDDADGRGIPDLLRFPASPDLPELPPLPELPELPPISRPSPASASDPDVPAEQMPPLLPVLPVIPFPAPGLEPTVPPFPIMLPTPLPGVPPIAPFPPVPPVEPAPGQPPVLPEPVLPIILPYLIPSPSPLELLSGRGTFNFSGLPSLGEIPELRGLPNLRELPDFPGLGQLPHLPSLGELPQLPQLPGLGELPQLPQLPGLPNLPRIPGLADRPRIPGIGELPQIPGLGDYIRPPPATSPNVNAFGNFTGIELPGLPSLTELLREPANIDRIQKTIQEALRQVAADPLNLERLRQSFQDLLGLIAPQEMFQLQQHAMAKKQIEVFEVKLSAKDILDSTERVAEKLAAAKAVKMDDASIANIGSLGDIPEIRALDESFQRLRTVLEQLLAPLTQLLAGLDLPRLPSVA